MFREYQDKMFRGYEDKYVLVASGPSLTQEQVNQCKGKAKVLVINDNYKLAPWADHHYACDQHWWKWHEDNMGEFQGQKWTQNTSWDEKELERLKKNSTFE